MSSFKKIFRHKACKSCTSTCGKSHSCRTCKDGSNYDELYNADPNCVHKIIHAGGGGIRCEKCNGWFCF